MNTLINILQRTFVPLLAAIILLIATFGPLSEGWSLALTVIALPVFLLGVYDWFQIRFTITRNYPVLARIRWLFYELRPFLRQYIVEGDLEGTPYSFEARNLVHARARGITDTNPFGSDRNMDEAGYTWLAHSMNPVEDVDENPRITVGNSQCLQPYSCSVFNISAMSFGALSANAIEALNLGAARGGFYHDTGEGGISKYHKKHQGDLVWEIGTGYFGCRDDDGNFDPEKFRETSRLPQVKMIELKVSQGAKPGHGGMLPGAKVTAEISAARQVPQGKDCISPRHHKAFSSPVGMLEFVAEMRDLSGGKPVGIKFCVGQPHEVMALVKAMLKTKIYPDFIVVDGAEGGTGAAPLELSDWVGMPLTEGLILVRNALVGTGLREHVKIAASGQIYSGMGLVKNLAIGADWCNAARAFMFSVGCIQAKRCHEGKCPTGIATQDPLRQRGLVVDVQGERSARFHRKTVAAMMDMVAGAGLNHPDDLRPHHLTTRKSGVEACGIQELHTFLEPNALLDHPEKTPYAVWWKAASPDSFAPVYNPESNVIASTGAAGMESTQRL